MVFKVQPNQRRYTAAQKRKYNKKRYTPEQRKRRALIKAMNRKDRRVCHVSEHKAEGFYGMRLPEHNNYIEESYDHVRSAQFGFDDAQPFRFHRAGRKPGSYKHLTKNQNDNRRKRRGKKCTVAGENLDPARPQQKPQAVESLKRVARIN
jgi:hypothetical protein